MLPKHTRMTLSSKVGEKRPFVRLVAKIPQDVKKDLERAAPNTVVLGFDSVSGSRVAFIKIGEKVVEIEQKISPIRFETMMRGLASGKQKQQQEIINYLRKEALK